MKSALKSLKQSFNQIRAHPAKLLYASLSDLAFIIISMFFTAGIMAKALDYAIAAGSLTARASPDLGKVVGQGQTFLSAIVSIDGVRPLVIDLMLLAVLYFIGIYIFYILFQGVSWYLSGKIARKKIQYYDFIIKFAKMNILWILVYVIFSVIRFFIRFIEMTSSRPYAGQKISIALLVPLLAIILCYFIISSYTSLFKKARWNAGIYLTKEHMLRFVIALLFITIIHIIQVFAFKLSIPLGGTLFIFLEIPSITLARIYIIGEEHA